MNLIPFGAEVRTMTSREVADLTGKRQDNVSNDIRKMLDELGLHAPDFSGTYRTDRGNEYECFRVVRITRNWPWGSELREGDLAFVVSLKVASPAVAEVSHNGKTWWIDPAPGIHAELVQAAPAAPVTLDRDKAEKLCQLYELYRKAHDHATAFELAYGIEVEGLPF